MAHPKKGSPSVVVTSVWMIVILIGGLSTLASVSCSKKDDESKPAAIPPMAGNPPPSEPPPPQPPPPPMPMPSALPAGHPPMPAAGEPAPAAAAPSDPKATITGTIVLAPARRADVAPDNVIFLVARRIADNPSARGTLVAVKKLSAASFPIPFVLSANDMMIPTGGFDGEVSISVRVDKDGDPMTRRKGDVFGGVPKVKVGAQKVKVVLDQLQKEDESLAAPGPESTHAGMPGMPGMPPGHP